MGLAGAELRSRDEEGGLFAGGGGSFGPSGGCKGVGLCKLGGGGEGEAAAAPMEGACRVRQARTSNAGRSDVMSRGKRLVWDLVCVCVCFLVSDPSGTVEASQLCSGWVGWGASA